MPEPSLPGVNVDGYFQGGDPVAGIAPTRLDADWLNAVMMEAINVIIGAGITPNKAERNQLYKAIYKLIYGTLPDEGAMTGLLASPLAADTALAGFIGVDLELIANSGSNDVNFTAAQLYINGGFRLASDKSTITQISNDAFSNSDVIVPTQAAIKNYIDTLDMASLGWARTDQTLFCNTIATIAISSGDVDFGLVPGVPIVQPYDATLKNIQIKWQHAGGDPNTAQAIIATFIILKNGSTTAITGTTTGSESSNSFVLSGTLDLSAGDTFMLRINVSGSSANAVTNPSWAAELEVI